jgi:hypothetical protein
MTSIFSTKDSKNNILLCNHLKHLVIDLLVAKDRISSSDQTHHGMLGWKCRQKV